MVSVSRGRGSFLGAFVALAAIAAGASGCSSSDEESREAANLGTRVCILNSWTEKVSVKYTKKDTATREGLLGSGEQSCAEGTSVVTSGDVNGTIEFPEPARALYFAANNPWVGAPVVELRQFSANVPESLAPSTECIPYRLGYDVGETRDWDNGSMRVSIKRLPDDQWKEFILIIEPSQPEQRGCRGSGLPTSSVAG